MSSGRGFDRLARVYRTLEFVSFGRSLERARFALLDRLRTCREVLVLGEGDGRCLERLLRIAPQAHVDCVDFSAAMLARAEQRVTDAQRARVRFLRLDVLADDLPNQRYDAVVTLFFLDCFTDEQLSKLVPGIAAQMRPGGQWLWADFGLPARGFARLWARCWLRLLYSFFRWQTALSARTLPDAEGQIEAAGFVRLEERALRGGLLRCAVFRDERGGA